MHAYTDEVKSVSTVTVNGAKYVTATRAAEVAGVARDTFTSYVSRGLAPDAAILVGDQRLWKLTDVTAWQRKRPGRGARTDLQDP